MGLVGYDWEPRGVEIATADRPEYQRHAADARDYVWQQGASLAAEAIATNRTTLFTAEHALHVLEVIGAARESQSTGRRVALRSTFRWPVIS
jgi:predicted dehydrogenase